MAHQFSEVIVCELPDSYATAALGLTEKVDMVEARYSLGKQHLDKEKVPLQATVGKLRVGPGRAGLQGHQAPPAGEVPGLRLRRGHRGDRARCKHNTSSI